MESSGSGQSSGGKNCYVCGADLSGQRRYKNEQGYYCPACARQMDKNDEAKERADDAAGLVKCPSCRRKLKPAAFGIYQGRTLCKQCIMSKQEGPGLKVAKVELTHHAVEDKRRLYVLGAIAGLLGLISLLSFFRVIGG
jgi:hypothetical protein